MPTALEGKLPADYSKTVFQRLEEHPRILPVLITLSLQRRKCLTIIYNTKNGHIFLSASIKAARDQVYELQSSQVENYQMKKTQSITFA